MTHVPEPEEGETIYIDDIVVPGPVLDLPDPPAGLRWDEVRDYESKALLDVNGIDSDDLAQVRDALSHPVDVLVAAAAAVLGMHGDPGGAVASLVDHPNDHVQVAAAFALARNGHASAIDTLAAMLELPLGPYLTAPEAAGCLARLGDTRGWGVIERALADPQPAVRIVGARQLGLFVGLPDCDPWRLYDQALEDSDDDVRWQAAVQLDRIDDPRAGQLLNEIAGAHHDATLREWAQRHRRA